MLRRVGDGVGTGTGIEDGSDEGAGVVGAVDGGKLVTVGTGARWPASGRGVGAGIGAAESVGSWVCPGTSFLQEPRHAFVGLGVSAAVGDAEGASVAAASLESRSPLTRENGVSPALTAATPTHANKATA